jgi:hypothetical protein
MGMARANEVLRACFIKGASDQDCATYRSLGWMLCVGKIGLGLKSYDVRAAVLIAF